MIVRPSLAALLLGLTFLVIPAHAQDCVECHLEETPNIVTDWQLSTHSTNDVDCIGCHGDEHTTAEDVIYSWSEHTQVYYLSGRRSAAEFIWPIQAGYIEDARLWIARSEAGLTEPDPDLASAIDARRRALPAV